MTEKERVAAAVAPMGGMPASAWEELVKVSEASKTTSTVDQLPEIILGAVGGALLVIILAIALYMHLRSAKAGTLGGKLKHAMTMTKSFYMPRKPKEPAALRAYVTNPSYYTLYTPFIHLYSRTYTYVYTPYTCIYTIYTHIYTIYALIHNYTTTR